MILQSDSFAIHPTVPEDLNAILEVYRQCEDFLALGPVSTASMEMVLSDLELSKRQGGIFCGIYATDGRMIGVLDYVPGNWEGDAHAAFLSLLMLAAPFRGQGIGAAVVEAVEKEVRKDAQITMMRSGVQANNPQAIKFWQRHGYRIVSGPIHYPDQTTAFDLRKDFIP